MLDGVFEALWLLNIAVDSESLGEKLNDGAKNRYSTSSCHDGDNSDWSTMTRFFEF